MFRFDDDDNDGKPAPVPPSEQPLPEQDDSNLGDDFTKVGEGEDLPNADQ